MNKKVLAKLQKQLKDLRKTIKHFETKLNQEDAKINNTNYIKLLSKLSLLEKKERDTKQSIRSIRLQNRIDKRLIVTLRSRVKLVSIDFEFTLWVDAKNTTELLGRRIGEIINIDNSNFKIAGIY